jgi:hypothetical protein
MPLHNELDSYSGPEAPGVNEYLRERHGEGFMGFQTYRVVHSRYLFGFSAGDWHDWDKSIPAAMRGELVADDTGRAVTAGSRAERRVLEMRRTPKYPLLFHVPGWILERWMAPAYFGAPGAWNERTAPGSTMPALGPYPRQGEYIHIGGPYSVAPSGPFCDRIVEQWELMRDDVLALAAETYVRKRHYEAEEEDREASERWNREASAANIAAMQPLLSTFLEGGRARQLAIEHAGLTGHYGN